jgi:uncharacterized protein (TIGR02679 family)
VTSQTETYLGEPGFTRLWQAARTAFERNGGLGGQALVTSVSAEEASALNGLLRRRQPLRAGADVRLPLAVLDEALREFACPLEDVLGQLGGRLANRPAERAAAGAREAAIWTELTERANQFPALLAAVDDFRSSGLLKRLARGDELQLGRQTLSVLESLLGGERAIIDLAVLAARLCGDAKALNDGKPLATLVLRALAVRDDVPTPANAAERRALWERYGVVCDPLSSHVLCLNLPLTANDAVGAAAAAHSKVGEPLRFTLRALRRFPPQFAAAVTVYICENPAVVSAAAEVLGEGCAPLVCTDGRPVVAVNCLIEHAAEQGCTLRYHGDFDWPGVEMAKEALRRYEAEPWRLSADDYRRALAAGAATKALKGRRADTPWDPALGTAMSEADLMVEEEAVIDGLLEDLAAGAPRSHRQ